MLRLLPAALLAWLIVIGRAEGQPRPSDATPLDYIPPVSEAAPSELLPAPAIENTPWAPPAAPRADPGPDISPSANRLRYVWYGGRWWYRQPTNRWSYWSQGRWVDYVPPSRGNTQGFIQPPQPVRRPYRSGVWGP